jgi:glycosyltransferase involved in cell wall biosynthesis
LLVTLLSDNFSRDGFGTHCYSYEVYEALRGLVDLNIIDLNRDVYAYMPDLRRGARGAVRLKGSVSKSRPISTSRGPVGASIYARTLASWAVSRMLEKVYLYSHLQSLRNNVHVLAPGLLPSRIGEKVKHKICTLHDIYLLENSSARRGENFRRQRQLNLIVKDYYRLRSYDSVIAVSETTAQKAVNVLGVDKSKVTVIYPVINKKFFRPRVFQAGHRIRYRLGYINSFGWNKLPKLLSFIETVNSMEKHSIELYIYGRDFPVNILGRYQWVRYGGFLPESLMVETMQSLDAYLSTSTVEGFGLPVMQAKACGVPVLCYDGDLPDIVRRNTVIWNENNLEATLEKCLWEKVDTRAAYLDAEECRAERISKKLIRVYESVFV